ncbi:hypothetical protein J6590_038403 [Homalodisca vitripennis]|nr:hypothetical protein J6590_038403 [Homalodisca vitripennis]
MRLQILHMMFPQKISLLNYSAYPCEGGMMALSDRAGSRFANWAQDYPPDFLASGEGLSEGAKRSAVVKSIVGTNTWQGASGSPLLLTIFRHPPLPHLFNNDTIS